MIDVLAHTVGARPYVFLFLGMFLAAAWVTLGRWRALALLGLGYGVAFVSEWSSIRTGFPYGHYHYLYGNLDPLELVVGGRPPAGAPVGTAAGVPFFDSVSYSFMAYVSYGLALFFTQPLSGRGLDLQLADTPRTRAGWPQWAVATLFMGLLDVVVDPVAHLGDRWFLGLIYGYAERGAYFGIPLTNFLGWWFVAGTIFLLFGRLELRLAARPAWNDAGCRRVPARALVGPALYACVLGFNLAVTYWLGELHLALAGTFIFLPVAALFLVRAAGAGGRASPQEVAEHERAYPALAGRPLEPVQ